MNDAGLIQAAKLVRSYLSELVSADEASDWDRRLGTLLVRETGERQMAADLLIVLRSDEVVLQWVEDVLDDRQQLHVTATVRAR